MQTRWFSGILFCAVAIGFAMMLVGGSSQPLQAQTSDGLPDLDVVLVIDESGSMWLTNDPEVSEGSRNDRPGWRIVVAKLFADLLGVDQSGSDHRLAVVVYGTDGKLVKPLSSMQDEVVRTEFKQAIDDAHENMRWTDIPEALELAQQELDSHGRTGPNVKQAVIFLTDGKYEIHENMTAEETRQAHAQIIERMETRFAGRYPVYTLGLTESAFEAESDYAVHKNLLEKIAFTTGGQYFELEKAEDELLDVYIKIMRDLFDLPPTTLTPASSPTEISFTIPPDLFQIIFTVVKYNKDIVTTIIRPDGRQVENTDTGVEYAISPQTDSYSLLRPEPGEWIVRLTGDGRATFVAIPFPKNRYKVDRLIPGPIHPQGKPMSLVVRVVDDDQKSQQATSLDVTVQLPDGSSQSLVLQPEEDRYFARLDDTTQEGTYQLNFRGTNNNTQFESEQTIRVMKLPWIDVLEPVPDRQYPTNRPLPVRGQLMFGTEPVAQPDPTDRLEGEARIIKANDESVDTGQLRLAPGGQLSGTLQVDDEGLYRVQARLKLTKPNGETFEDISEVQANIQGQVTPTASPPPPPTLRPADTPAPSPTPQTPPPPPNTGAMAGGALGLLALAASGGIAWWWWRLPALTGSLDVGGQMYPLSGKRPLTIGADPRSPVPIMGQGVAPKHAKLSPIGSRGNPQVEIRGLDASLPIKVNGMEVLSQILGDGDQIEIGDQSLVFNNLASTNGLGDDFSPDGSDTDGLGF